MPSLRNLIQGLLHKKTAMLNRVLDKRTLAASFETNLAAMKQLFKDDDTMMMYQFRNNHNPSVKFCIAYCQGLVDSRLINEDIIRPLMRYEGIKPGKDLMVELTQQVLLINDVFITSELKQIIESVTYGDTILFVSDLDQALILSSKNFTSRAIAEPDSEKILSGPREGFIETLMTNLSMVRRRLRSNDVKFKFLTLGERTNTRVCVCYIDSIVNKDILSELNKRLSSIDIDGILDANYITELIRDGRYSLFRTTGYTERPDVVTAKLLEGRIAIFIDGTPVVLTVPYLFIENFQSNEDYYLSFYYTSFSRLLRMAGFILTIIIPAFYIAIVAYSHEMLPTSLFINIAIDRQSVPFPAALESFIMLIIFDILRETGIRMPSNVGQALSIVGALVIGQAAVEAKLVAAPMIIVTAMTGITSLLVPKLNASVIPIRFMLLFLASTLGLIGLILGVSMLMINLLSLHSLGVPLLLNPTNLKYQAVKDTWIRAPWWQMVMRPEGIATDRTRMKEKEMKPQVKKIAALITMLLALNLLSGCWNYLGLNQLTIVVGIAIDKQPDDTYRACYEVIDLKKSTKDTGMKAKIIEAYGETLTDAVSNAKMRLSDELYFGNADLLIISEEIAKEDGITPIISLFMKARHTRETVNVVISQMKTAKDLLVYEGSDAVIVSTDIREIIDEDIIHTGSLEDIAVYQAYSLLNSQGQSLVLPAFHQAENAGQIVCEANGLAIFKGDKLVGYLSPKESQSVIFINNMIDGGLIVIDTADELPVRKISLSIIKSKTIRSFTYENGSIQMMLTIKVNTILKETTGVADLDSFKEETVKLIESMVAETLMERLAATIRHVQQDYKTDIFGFGNFIYRTDYPLWVSIGGDWDALFPQVKVNIDCTVIIENTDLTKGY